MNNMLKIELKRAFCNKWFFLSVLCGCVLTVSQVFGWLPDQLQLLEMRQQYEKYASIMPYTVFNTYIGLEAFTVQSTLFYLLLPILAVIPYAYSFLEDYKSGYLKNITLRTKKSNYMIGKCCAAFLSGGTAVVLPLLLNLLLMAMFFPSISPELGAYSPFTVNAWDLWNELFYSHPYGYIAAFLVLDFVYAGLFALLAVAVTYFIKKQFILLLVPFLVFEAASLFANQLEKLAYDPVYFLKGAQIVTNEWQALFGGISLLLLLTLPVLCIRTRKLEIY